MSISIRFDNNNMPIEPTLVLMTRSAKKLGAINAHNLNATDNLKGCSEFFFSVEKCDAENIWDYLVDFKLVWVREWNQVYEIYVEYKESQGFVKNVTAKSLGHAELSQINIYDLNANNETDIEIDDVRTVLYSENDAEHSLLNRIIDEKAPHYSINHVDTWVRNIQRTFEFDDINIIDAFSKIEEEVDCIILIDTSIDGTTGLIKREINVYDLEYYCSGSDCNYRGNFVDTCPICGGTNILPGYGNDTSIFVSADNLSDEINLSVNTDSVKNCFKLEAGDDLMTATVVNCNPNGSQYLWYITDETKADMPSELVGKIEDYDELYETYQSTHSYDLSSATSAYNAVANTYKSIDQSLQTITSPVYGFQNLMVAYYNAIDLRLFVNDKCMPSVTLDAVTKETEIAKLTSSSLSPIAVQSLQNVSTATATSSVEAIAKTFINSIFSVNATASGEISKTTEGGVVTAASWSGTITITSYADESQTATTSNLTLTLTDNQTDYVKQRINKILSSKDDDDKYGIVSLFNKSLSAFETELAKYSLSNLQIISDCCQGCLDVLMSMGAANPNTWYDDDLNDDFDYDDNVSTVTYNGNSSTGWTINYYRSYYKPYYKRYLLIQDEMDVRSGEVADVDAMMNLINEKIDATHEALNFGAYLGDTLWEVFSSYRRDDIFSNDNFISDGLDNAEMFAMAREFINDATKEIYKSATLQHTITATLNNLLVIKEFAPIVDYFQVGNWIRIRIEDDVYKLRLISYTVDFDDLNNINVEFSDITKLIDGLSDIESLLDSASSMATSYDYVRRQSKKGLEGNEQLRHWVEDGLSLTNLKIVSTAEEQDIAFDEHGLLAREYLPLTDTYDDKQLKIINRGLFVTNDNWRTCKAGIGDFLFYDPEESEIVEGYGVIADTIVGNIILGEEVGIYNAEGSVTINEDGMKICADMTNGNTTTDTMFKIQRKVDDDTATLGYKIEDLLYLDTDGDLVVNGTLKVFTDGQSSSSSIVDIASGISSEDVDQKINDANALLQQNISNNYYTKSQSDSLISNATSNINSSIASAISNLEIGGRNMLLKSNSGGLIFEPSSYRIAQYAIASGCSLVTGETYSISVNFTNTSERIAIVPSIGGGAYLVGSWKNIDSAGTHTFSWTFQATSSMESATKRVNVYSSTTGRNQGSETISGTCTVNYIKLEKGNIVTDWTPAPEDTETYADNLVADLKEQVDNKIQTFNQTSDPSIGWSSTEKTYHTGDLWYHPTDKVTKRWSGTEWVTLENAEAQSAANIAASKAQVFTGESTPTTPYYVGDLWITASDGSGGFGNKNGVMKTCIRSRTSGDGVTSDWVEGVNYTDDSAVNNLTIGGRNYISSSTLRWTENSMFALSTGVATKAIGAIRMTDKISVDSGDGYYLSMYGDNLSGTTMLITEYTSNDTFIRSVTNVQPGAISFSNNCAKIGVSLYNYFNDQYQIIEPTTYSNTYSITPQTGAVGYSPIIIGGKSIVMTQLIPNGNFANDVYVAYQSTYSISNNKLTITSQGTGSSVRVCTNNDSRSSVVKGHIYYYRAKAKSSVNTTVRHGFNSNVSSSINVQANTLTIVDALKTATSSGSYSYNYYFNATSTGQTCEYSNSICIDLTKMFGSGNEPTTVEQVRSMFPADYYEYNTGSILNIGCAKIIIKNSNNTITSTLDIPQDIQDLPAYGCSAGSVYNYIDYAEKKYHQCVGSRSFQSGDDSNSSYVTDGAITYYPLSTEVVTDISSLISDELMYSVEVSSGGSVAFAYDTAESYRLPVKTLSKFSYTRVANATVNRLNSDVSATWLSNGLLKIKLEKGNKATDWSPAPEDTASEISSIGSTSERLISESEERLINDISDVEGRLNNTIMIQNEEISTIQGLIEALNKQSNAISEEIKSQDDNLREYTNQRLSDAMAPYGIWLSTDRDGIRIGNTENGVTSAFYTKITNTEIGFYENENKVAYISDQHLFINNATIQDRLVFGDYNTNHFFFSEDNDHGMVITWVEQ